MGNRVRGLYTRLHRSTSEAASRAPSRRYSAGAGGLRACHLGCSGHHLPTRVGGGSLQGRGRPSNVWAVLVLAVALVAALLWGLRRGPRVDIPEAGGVRHYYGSGVTVQQFGSSADVARVVTASGSRLHEGVSDNYEVLRPWNLFESVPPPNGAPMIIGHAFRYVEIRGPALLALSVTTKLLYCEFGILQDDIETTLWSFGDESRPRLGVIGLEQCVFEHCRFESIGWTSTTAGLDALRRSSSSE